jgi:ketosteroid isomerase-like protein
MDPATLARRYFEMWNTGDTGAVAELLAPEWVDHAHPEVTGPESVAGSVRAIRAARPGLRFEIESVLADSGRAAVVGSAGPARLVWLFTVRDGRLADLRTFRDTTA